MKYKVFLIGFGEAAYHIAKGLKDEGLAPVGAYDLMLADPKASAHMRARAEETGVTLHEDKDACFGNAEFVFSLTSASVAVRVAEGIVPYLTEGQVYVDMNSAEPSVKQRIAAIEHAPGVKICDAAVMGTVPGNGHRVPMFLAGDGAQRFAEAMTPYGMKLKVLDSPEGSASAIKMIKSVIMKGYAQLMLESFVAAERYGVLDVLVKSLSESLDGKSVEKLADTFVARTMIHAKRRADEMRDVGITLDGLGCDSEMTRATIAKLDALANGNWKEKLGPDGAKMPFQEAIALLSASQKE